MLCLRCGYNRLIILISILFIFPSLSSATINREGIWAGLFTTKSFEDNKKLLYLLGGQLRLNLDEQNRNTINLRYGLGYQFNQNWKALAGYHVFIKTPDDQWRVVEQRIWQQLNGTLKRTNEWFVNSSYRLEQRFVQGQSSMAWRLRSRLQLFRYNPSLKKINPFIADELFFNLNQTDFTTPYAVNQNRLFLGVTLPQNNNQRLNIGYLNLLVFKQPQNVMRHILFISYFF